MGIATGIDLEALLACARRVQEMLGRPLGSHTLWRAPSLALGRPGAAGELPAGCASRAASRAWRHAVLLHGDLHLERLRERRPGGGVDHALGASDGDVRVGEQFLDERLRGVLELLGGRRRG